MAAPKHVAKKLREMLGNEAGESMVEWLDERDTHHDDLRRETRAGFAAADARIEQRFAPMEIKFAQRNAELMKWALGFWIASLLGVLGALAALTRVPR